MTEVYGQFFEVLEELNFPLEESTFNNTNNEKSKKLKPKNKKSSNDLKLDFINHLFVTLEKVNNLSQYESSESLCSLTSNNSMASMGSHSTDIEFESSVDKVFNAFQSVTLNNYESTNSFNDESHYNKQLSQTLQKYSFLLPSIVKHFFTAFDDFMHNHDDLAAKKLNEVEESNNDFPKLC